MKIDQPFHLSVITVCRNSASTIGRTLQSLRDQTDNRFESIVIDGGSDDRTLEIVREYGDVVSQAVSEEDHGIYWAMNKGIALARGSHLAFLNSDDAYLPHTIEHVASAAQDFPKAILYGNLTKERTFDGITHTREEVPDLKRMPKTMGIFHPATFTPALFFETLGPYDTRFRHAADYHWFLRAFLSGIDFHYIDRPLAVFSLGGVSTGSCTSYREAAEIQRELRTGHHKEMERLYRICQWKMRRGRLISGLNKWPVFRSIYKRKVANRWK